MTKLFAAAIAALLSCTALAQAPANTNNQASELARKLGQERSAEGLETILSSGNVDLLSAYDHGFYETGMRLYTSGGNKRAPVPADVEAVMLRHYQDPVVGPRITGLCGKSGMACQTQALFDLMLAEWRSGKPRPGASLGDAVLSFQAPGADAALIAWLDAADAPTGGALDSVIQTLGVRKSAGAAPAIAAAMAKAPPGKSGNAPWALSQIGTAAAAEALLVRLESLKRAPPSKEITEDARRIAGSLAQFPPTVPISYARLRATLPENIREYSVQWLLQRKDLAAVPDALVLLVEPATYSGAINALVATDSPEVWKQARAALEKGKNDGRLQPNQYSYAISMLDAKIADPAKHLAEKQAIQKDADFRTHSDLLGRDLLEARKLKESNPQAYVMAVREYLAATEKLGADYPDSRSAKFAVELALRENSMELAHYVRFRQKKPREALDLYAAAEAHGQMFAALAIADTWQYDLGDKQRALAEYKKMVARAPSREDAGKNENLALQAWGQRWLAAQIDYLATGKKFGGTLYPEDTAPMMLVLSAGQQSDTFGLSALARRTQSARGAGGKPADRAEFQSALSALPSSVFALQASILYVSYLPGARAILAHLARQDPAGFATASYFALLDQVGRSPEAAGYLSMLAPGMSAGGSDPMREAKTRFFSERRIDMKALAPKPADKRMSSPQATWDLFIASLRKADLATAMSCLTPQIQARFRPLFSQMSPAEMRTAADSFKAFKLSGGFGEYQEAFVVRSDGKAGSVTFVNSGGTWRIDEM